MYTNPCKQTSHLSVLYYKFAVTNSTFYIINTEMFFLAINYLFSCAKALLRTFT